MAKFDLTAGARHTDGASLLEKFLDENAERIPPELFGELDNLAGDIENVEVEKNKELEELGNEFDDLKSKFDELEEKLNE